jgi:3-hydroxybutyrate dehydrogenase
MFHCMKADGSGQIINIASTHGLVASAWKVAYVAAKHSELGVTRVAAIELAADGVILNAISPGWVRTPLVESNCRTERQGMHNGVVWDTCAGG